MASKKLDTLVAEGLKLLQGHKPTDTHYEYDYWVEDVMGFLKGNYAELPFLGAEWVGLGNSELVSGGSYSNDPDTWYEFRQMVKQRLTWLGSLSEKVAKPKKVSHAYIADSRIAELRQLPTDVLDVSKLVRLCEEVNISFDNDCFFATAMLVRAILDHVPPIFGFQTFVKFSEDYNKDKHNEGRSFKAQMVRLQAEARKIADGHLHEPIRSSETLPTGTQVNFSNTLDSLLAEIIRVLK